MRFRLAIPLCCQPFLLHIFFKFGFVCFTSPPFISFKTSGQWRSSRGIQDNTDKFWFPSFPNYVYPHPSNDLLIDLDGAGFKLQEDCFAQAMSRLPARWVTCDHTFKNVANIGYKRPSDSEWIKLYSFVHFEREGGGFAMAIYKI